VPGMGSKGRIGVGELLLCHLRTMCEFNY
jgi:hypothetical protein